MAHKFKHNSHSFLDACGIDKKEIIKKLGKLEDECTGVDSENVEIAMNIFTKAELAFLWHMEIKRAMIADRMSKSADKDNSSFN